MINTLSAHPLTQPTIKKLVTLENKIIMGTLKCLVLSKKWKTLIRGGM